MRNYTQFSLEERKKLYFYLEMKWSVSKIAKVLCKNRASIYREIKRNRFKNKYIGSIANTIALERRGASRKNKIEENPKLKAYILKRLQIGWSPEQIAGRLKKLKKGYSICTESIYRYIYSHIKKGWYKYLSNEQRQRQKRHSRHIRQVRYEGGKSIHERSKEAETRNEVGHWEGDTIGFNTSRRACITTLVERKTLYTLLTKNDRKISSEVMGKIRGAIESMPKKLWKTVVFDQGGEFADYRKIERSKRCLVYYCDAHAPWQKGCNENTNKRLRRYLPRFLNIENFTEEQVKQLNEKINKIPRKKLGYLMPKEALALEFKNNCRT
jgi:IS30 family transposase